MKVYLIKKEEGNMYKIGVSNNPKKRLQELQTGNPDTLTLVETYNTIHNFKLENFLHRTYSDKNVQLEWFELTTEDVKSFISNCEKGENIFNLLEQQNTYIIDRNEKGLF
jgi:hypothetical protein